MSDATAIAVLGAGGHGKVVISTLLALGCEILAAFDDAPEKLGTSVLGVRVEGPLSAVDTGTHACILAVGDNRVRARLAERFDRAARWATLAHPRAYVDPAAEIGPGTVVFAGAVVQAGAVVGRHVIINSAAVVEHDCRIADFSHVAAGATLGGEVHLGSGVLVGAGCTVAPGLRLGDWSTAGAGAAVVRTVEPGATVVGVPARPLPETDA